MYQTNQGQKKIISPSKLPTPPKSCKKYKEASSVIDTGPNLRKRQEALDMIQKYCNVRPDELFRRIKITTLVTLMVEAGRVQLQSATKEHSQDHQHQQHQQRQDHGRANTTDKLEPRQTDLQSLIHGTGELSLSAGDAQSPPPSVDDRPYLLLDVRDVEAFERGHIATARHYPAARLARTMNYETPEMWCYKQHAQALVVVYDEDEQLARRCATTLAQRGYDNVFLLSGGLRRARVKFPYGLMTDEEKQQLSAIDLETLNNTLENVLAAAVAQSPRTSGAGSSRSVCSSVLSPTRPEARASGAAGRRWKL